MELENWIFITDELKTINSNKLYYFKKDYYSLTWEENTHLTNLYNTIEDKHLIKDIIIEEENLKYYINNTINGTTKNT